jgi:hypothetical protein
VYPFALTVRFHDKPLFLAWTLIAVPTFLKGYPVVGDTGFMLVTLLLSLPLLKFMRPIFPLVYLFFQSLAVSLLMWFLWIHPGSGNGNFLYFQTLIFGFCNGFLIVEAVSAVRRLQVESQLVPEEVKAFHERIQKEKEA